MYSKFVRIRPNDTIRKKTAVVSPRPSSASWSSTSSVRARSCTRAGAETRPIVIGRASGYPPVVLSEIQEEQFSSGPQLSLR